MTFTVPAGTDRLAAADDLAGCARSRSARRVVTPVVRLSIFDPSGTYVTNSRPQGGAVSANYANLDVRKPARRHLHRGDLHPGQRLRLHRLGQPADHRRSRPSRSVRSARRRSPWRPAQPRTCRSPCTVPAAGGDTSYAVTFASSDGHQTAVAGGRPRRGADRRRPRHASAAPSPVATPGLVRRRRSSPTPSTCPAGKRDLSVGVTLASDPNYQLEGVLVDPNDETQAIDSNWSSADPFTLGCAGPGPCS